MSAAHPTAAIVPAAGSGTRLGVGIAKALHKVGAQSLLELAVRSLADARLHVAGLGADGPRAIDLIVVAAPPAHLDDVLKSLAFLADPGIESDDAPDAFVDSAGTFVAIDDVQERDVPGLMVVAGGATRQESVANALAVLPDDVELVLVHDAARALAPVQVIERVLASLHDGAQAVVPAIPIADTVKLVEDAAVLRTLDRSSLRAVQTPQGFTRAALERAHQAAQERGDTDTSDDAGLCEAAGIPVRVVDGDALAFKITRPLDLVLAEAVLGARE
ncbi:MAG: IspD/TarI family cytidylyltransferase [Candidatus Nanopelagicales bacterium]